MMTDWYCFDARQTINKPDAPNVFNTKSTVLSRGITYGINTRTLPTHPAPSDRYCLHFDLERVSVEFTSIFLFFKYTQILTI